MSVCYGKPWFIVVGTVALLSVAATAVSAHARLTASDPADKAILTTAPTRITLTFSEETSPTKSGGSVTDASGAAVSTGFKVDLNERTKMTIGLKPDLPDGTYTVKWNSLTEDDNGAADGSFTFTVQAAAGAGTATSMAQATRTGTVTSNSPTSTAMARSTAITATSTATIAPTITTTATRSTTAVATGGSGGVSATPPTTLPQTGKRPDGTVFPWIALVVLAGGAALAGGIAFRTRVRRS